MPGGKHRADAGTRSHIQDFPIALHEPRIDLRRKELTGAGHFRIEHAGSDDKGHTMHPLQAEIVVSILAYESVAEGHRLAEESRHQRQPGNPQGMASGTG